MAISEDRVVSFDGHIPGSKGLGLWGTNALHGLNGLCPQEGSLIGCQRCVTLDAGRNC